MSTARWYVVKTKVRQEQVAQDNLRRQGFEAWLPQLVCERRRRGKWQPNREPMFPGYLFVELEAGVQNFSPIRSTRGVSSLVSFSFEPSPMPVGAVESLRHLHDNDKVGDVVTPFRRGGAVCIAKGAFSGWKGVYNTNHGSERVMIMLDIMGRQHSLSFPRDEVVPAC
jgi:transcriptional antiterminator RfaH